MSRAAAARAHGRTASGASLRPVSSASLRPSIAPRVGRAALVAALAVALGVFHVWARTRVVAAGYELGELQKEHVRLTSEHDRLRIEVETLRSPAALERFARTRLGMAPPAPGAVVAGMAGGKVWVGGVGDGAGQRPGPAEPDVKQVRRREGRTGPRVGASEAARP